MSKQYKYIDLSGYSFTGKGAYNNLFAEFEGYHTHPYDFEFDIIRTQNGILDLYISLVEEWSPVRSSEAIRSFKKVIQSYGGNKTLLDRLTTNGRHYDSVFTSFSEISEDYINSLIDSSWKGQWPYAFEKIQKYQILIYKILFNLGYKKIFENDVYLAAPTDKEFMDKTKKYLNSILSSNMSLNKSTIVMNNVFEPFNPLKSMQFFDNVKSIVIDRDPRDIYLAAWNYTNQDGSKGWKATLGSNVESFVQRFKLYRNKIKNDENSNILRITFEDLVFQYEQTLDIILNFIEEDKSIHINKKKYFDPEISKKGVGMWKNTSKKMEVDYIYQHLKEYCKDY